jgi:hypothetical protein
MNGLITKSKFGSQLGERVPILEYVYGIIDSKIDFNDLKTRKILDQFRSIEEKGMHDSDSNNSIPSMANVCIDNTENEQFFVHLESLSRSIYLLEQMKISLNEDNAFAVMQLLNDDNYLKINDVQFGEMLNLKPAA